MKKPEKQKRWRDATIAIHQGAEHFHVGAPVGTTIARTANFTFESTEEMKRWAEGKSSAYIYTRYGNPTLTIAEEKLAALEGAEAAIVTASGMAAISSALLAVLKAGDEVISTRQTYGGTYRLMRDNFPRFGIVVRYVENDLAGIEQLVNPRTKALYIETPTNPTLRLVDLQKAVAFAKEWGLISLIDNTFASPALQKPIELGFNIVLHSATKYLSGHSDLIAGAAAGSRAIINEVRHNIINLGGSLDPEAAYLLIRGMKTLGVRMERQCENAMIVAKYLGEASQGRESSLSGTRFAPRSQTRQAPDERIRRNARLRFERRPSGRAALLRSRARLPCWRQVWAALNRSSFCRFTLRITICRKRSCALPELARELCAFQWGSKMRRT